MPSALAAPADRPGAFPLLAGIYGVRVQRGPSWDYGDQDGGAGAWGTVVKPDAATMETWADGLIDPGMGAPCRCFPRHYKGGWHIGRSCQVRWDSGSTFFYKCGDDGHYDLVFFPNVKMFFDTAAFAGVSSMFESIMIRKYRAEMMMLDACEELARDPGLVFMLRGMSPHTAAARIAAVNFGVKERVMGGSMLVNAYTPPW